MSHRPRKASPRPRPLRRGYVLVVTLAVLVLSAGLMVALGRSAVRHAVHAREARDDLQRRWGTASCRAAVLPVAERVLSAEEARAGGPVPSVRVVVRLGGQSFELTVADEQAKANVNRMLADVDVPSAEARLREALAGRGLVNKVRLRPGPPPSPSDRRPAGGVLSAAAARSPAAAGSTRPATPPELAGWRPITGLGQVLDDVPPADWLRPGVGGGGNAPADLITCWGDGAVNVRRAPEAVLRLGLSPPLSAVEVGRLIERRDDLFYARDASALRSSVPSGWVGGRGGSPPSRSPIRRLVDAAGLTAVGGRLLPRMVDGSTCHSLWVVADDGRRRRYDLAVRDDSVADRPVTHSFAW